MADVAVAFLWHQHQPYYPDDVSGDNPMPWVRLHAVKDYYGMALHLLEVPEMRCSINLVPSLLRQLEGYAERGLTDRALLLSHAPADGLSEEDCLYLLDNFFMANHEQMIRPYPRYYELLQRRAPGRNSAREALRRFNERDFRDLQVWFNLTWVHPLAIERDRGLADLIAKGRGFSEAEKEWLLRKHLEILSEVIPLHRRLAESGQVELTTTPYFHPILPLLFDKKLARDAMPDVKLPRYAGGYPEDAEVHVRRAVEAHARHFGAPPQGMWPAEGGVCQAMLPLLARHGIRWIATDEEILGVATLGAVRRDAHGHVTNPERLYRPYKVREGDSELSVVFRDHALSDMIGFHYQRSDGAAAADDFVRHLKNIGAAVGGTEPALVSVILDGENCWEHYPGGGVPFLRALYERCTRTAGVRPVKIGEYLAESPPRDALAHLPAGSWINHNFAIWVGHDEDNTAWDALHRTRSHLEQRSAERGWRMGDRGWRMEDRGSRIEGEPPSSILDPRSPILDPLQRAWEEIYIAEGSDWFWWYGDDHSSPQDALFDYLFRKHLQNVYLLLGEAPPPELGRPISRRGHSPAYTQPRAFLDVRLDGRQTFFEWVAAGKYACQNERGTMAMVTRGPLSELYFGFDLNTLLLRIDFDGRARDVLQEYEALRVGFVEPPGWELVVEAPSLPGARAELRHGGEHRGEAPLGIDQIAEVGIPFALLGLGTGDAVQFYVELLEGGQSRDRAPREGAIALAVPSPHFEQIMWDV